MTRNLIILNLLCMGICGAVLAYCYSTYMLPGCPINMNTVAKIESRGHNNATSSEGASGRFQIMPGTWARVTRIMYGHSIPFRLARNPVVAGKVANYYLQVIIPRELRRLHVPVTRQTQLASYNCGPGGVKRAYRRSHSGWIRYLPAETRGYLRKYARV